MAHRSKTLLFLLAPTLMAICFAVLLFLLHTRQKVIDQIDLSRNPVFPTVEFKIEKAPELFTVKRPGASWFTAARDIRDVTPARHGYLLATGGALAYADRDGCGVLFAGKSTGVLFSAAIKTISFQNDTFVVGKQGFLRLPSNNVSLKPQGNSYCLTGEEASGFVDAQVAGEALLFLTQKGTVVRWNEHRGDVLCRYTEGVPSALGAGGGYLFVGSVDGQLARFSPSPDSQKPVMVSGFVEAGRIEIIAPLPQNSMEGIGEGLLIGAASGLYFLRAPFAAAEPVATGLLVTSLVIHDGALFVGTRSGLLFRLTAADFANRGELPKPYLRHKSGILSLARDTDHTLLVGTEQGLFRLGTGDHPRLEPVVTTDRLGALPEPYVAALAFSRRNDRILYVGGLNTGLTAIDTVTGEVTALAQDLPGISVIRELGNGRIAVGATNGYYELDDSGTVLRRLTRNDGLIHNNVSGLQEAGSAVYAGTAAGLTRIEGGSLRSIYAFHGLVNNHLYALCGNDDGIWAATLAGACRIGGHGGLVVDECITEKSGLRHPWVTALICDERDVYFGTYGGGVTKRTTTGKQTLLKKYRGASINIGASTIAGKQACFGSLENGILCAKGDELIADDQLLPSVNVTALAAQGQRIAVGTDSGILVMPLEQLRKEQPVW